MVWKSGLLSLIVLSGCVNEPQTKTANFQKIKIKDLFNGREINALFYLPEYVKRDPRIVSYQNIGFRVYR